MKRILVVVLLLSSSTRALIPVTDVTANLIAAARLTAEVVHFADQMNHYAEQARSLTDFDWSYIGGIEKSLRKMDDLMRRTGRIAEDYGRLSRRFENSNKGVSHFSEKHKEWEQHSWKSMHNAFESHGAVDSSKSAIKPHEIAAIVRKTQKVKGTNESLQLIAAALGVQLNILQELKTIITADSQARLAATASDKIAKEEQEKAQKQADRDFMRNYDAPLGSRKIMNRLPRLGGTT